MRLLLNVLGVFALYSLIAVGCGGLLLDNRSADRAIAEVIP